MPGIIVSPPGRTVHGDTLASGESTNPRLFEFSGTVASSGVMRLAFFTAERTEAVANVRVACGAAAGATPTLCRVGVYSVASNGDLTLLSATANDTTLFGTASTWYTRALETSFTKQAGQRYAAGILIVSTATMPNIIGFNAVNSVAPAELSLPPRLTGQASSLTDIPASITEASLSATKDSPYVALLP